MKNEKQQEESVKMEAVLRSSNVAATGYVEASGMMIVDYFSGGRYRWKGIPACEYAAMRAAPSVGKYLRVLAEKYGKGTRIG